MISSDPTYINYESLNPFEFTFNQNGGNKFCREIEKEMNKINNNPKSLLKLKKVSSSILGFKSNKNSK